MDILTHFALLGEGATPSLQYLRPDRNYAEAQPDWTAEGETNFWECIDDVVADEDATYVKTLNVDGVWFKTPLSPARGKPKATQEHSLLLRGRYEGVASGGYTEIRLFAPFPDVAFILTGTGVLSPTYIDYEFSLSQAQIDEIQADGDYLDMEVWQFVDPTGEDPGWAYHLTQVYLRIGEEVT